LERSRIKEPPVPGISKNPRVSAKNKRLSSGYLTFYGFFFCCLGARADNNPRPVFSAILGCAFRVRVRVRMVWKGLRLHKHAESPLIDSSISFFLGLVESTALPDGAEIWKNSCA
jgi:hypothetical protein